jgi:hypothetical protein
MLDNESPIKQILDMVHSKSEDMLKKDPCYQHWKAVKWGEKHGLIRDLTPEEIQRRMDNREWRKVNKTIIQNENRNNDTDSSSHSG